MSLRPSGGFVFTLLPKRPKHSVFRWKYVYFWIQASVAAAASLLLSDFDSQRSSVSKINRMCCQLVVPDHQIAKLLWDALNCFEMLGNALLWHALNCSEMRWAALNCSGML